MYQDLKNEYLLLVYWNTFGVMLHIKCLTELKNVFEKKIMLLQNKGHICVFL